VLHKSAILSFFLRLHSFAQVTLAVSVTLTSTVLLTTSAEAQTFAVTHSFSGGGDGASPGAGLVLDRDGNFYGTTEHGGPGGPNGNGTAFRLTHLSSGWALTPLYSFAGGNDGANPQARVVFGPDGTLYGTTSNGGGSGCGGAGCGAIFNLRPAPHSSTTVFGAWAETVLYRFTGGNDGSVPGGDLVFDPAGNVYGTTAGGGSSGQGTVYELTPSNGTWTESVLWSFTGGNDGGRPTGGVIFDSSGKLYGATQSGGSQGFGSVFQLVPAHSGWAENVIYSFQDRSDGASPVGGLILDSWGNLYGTTASGGQGGGGTVFELTPSKGNWTSTVLDALTGPANGGPQASLTMDSAGNLYGATYKDGLLGYGSVFKLTPAQGGWTYTDFHNFTFGSDGAEPLGNLVLDADGNLYGTAVAAGSNGFGVVFEVTPLLITNTSLPSGTINRPYGATLTATGGLSPYTWSIIGGSLPKGLTLDTGSGVISGTPTSVGTYNFTVQVSDAQSPPAIASAPLSITIQYPTLSITTASLPSGKVDVSYSATLTATGGLPPYTWGIISGNLPTGLTLNAGTGVISGKPKTPGTFNFTVQVSDSQSPPVSANAPLALTIFPWTVLLSWTASTSPGVIGYNAYRSITSGGPYSEINSSLITTTTYNDQNVQSGLTYFYVTTAVNSQGMESAYSNQASATVP
jgi:uncharacterized repeat protein (TIGR03803 family)